MCMFMCMFKCVIVANYYLFNLKCYYCSFMCAFWTDMYFIWNKSWSYLWTNTGLLHVLNATGNTLLWGWRFELVKYIWSDCFGFLHVIFVAWSGYLVIGHCQYIWHSQSFNKKCLNSLEAREGGLIANSLLPLSNPLTK